MWYNTGMTWNDITGRLEKRKKRLDAYVEKHVAPRCPKAVKRHLKSDTAWAKKAAAAKPGLAAEDIGLMFYVNGQPIDKVVKRKEYINVSPNVDHPMSQLVDQGFDPDGIFGLAAEHGTEILKKEMSETAGKLSETYGLNATEAAFLAVCQVCRMHLPVLQAKFRRAGARAFINGELFDVSSGGRIRGYQGIYMKPSVPQLGDAEPVNEPGFWHLYKWPPGQDGRTPKKE